MRRETVVAVSLAIVTIMLIMVVPLSVTVDAEKVTNVPVAIDSGEPNLEIVDFHASEPIVYMDESNRFVLTIANTGTATALKTVVIVSDVSDDGKEVVSEINLGAITVNQIKTRFVYWTPDDTGIHYLTVNVTGEYLTHNSPAAYVSAGAVNYSTALSAVDPDLPILSWIGGYTVSNTEIFENVVLELSEGDLTITGTGVLIFGNNVVLIIHQESTPGQYGIEINTGGHLFITSSYDHQSVIKNTYDVPLNSYKFINRGTVYFVYANIERAFGDKYDLTKLGGIQNIGDGSCTLINSQILNADTHSVSTSSTSSVTIDGCLIGSDNDPATNPVQLGYGIYCTGGNPLVMDSSIKFNGGSGIEVTSGSAGVLSSEILGNYRGVAVADVANANIASSDICDNGYFGIDAIGTVQVDSCRVNSNFQGIVFSGGNTGSSVSGCIIEGNSYWFIADTGGHGSTFGEGILLDNAHDITISNSLIWDNIGQLDVYDSQNVLIENNIFSQHVLEEAREPADYHGSDIINSDDIIFSGNSFYPFGESIRVYDSEEIAIDENVFAVYGTETFDFRGTTQLLIFDLDGSFPMAIGAWNSELRIAGNDITGSNNGITLEGVRGMIDGNSISDNIEYGITAENIYNPSQQDYTDSSFDIPISDSDRSCRIASFGKSTTLAWIEGGAVSVSNSFDAGASWTDFSSFTMGETVAYIDLAVDGESRALVWQEGTGQLPRSYMVFSDDGGLTWTEPFDIVEEYGLIGAFWPSVDLGGGNIYLLYHGEQYSNHGFIGSSTLKWLDDGFSELGTTLFHVNVGVGTSLGYTAGLKVDGDTVHVVLLDDIEGDIEYWRGIDGGVTFQGPFKLADYDPTIITDDLGGCRLDIDAKQGFASIAYSDYVDGTTQIQLLRSTDDGLSWSENQITSGEYFFGHPSVAITPSGFTEVVYHKEDASTTKIYHQMLWHTDSSSSETLVTSSDISYNPSFSINGWNLPSLAWIDETSGAPRVYVKHYDEYPYLVIRNNDMTACSIGVDVNFVDVVIENNQISGNSADGIKIINSNVAVLGNTMESNTLDGIYLDGAYGRTLGNEIHMNGDSGIRTVNSKVVLDANSISSQISGVYLESSEAIITDNIIDGNSGWGILSMYSVLVNDGDNGEGLPVDNPAPVTNGLGYAKQVWLVQLLITNGVDAQPGVFVKDYAAGDSEPNYAYSGYTDSLGMTGPFDAEQYLVLNGGAIVDRNLHTILCDGSLVGYVEYLYNGIYEVTI